MATKRSTYGSVDAASSAAALRRVLLRRLKETFDTWWWDWTAQPRAALEAVALSGPDVGLAINTGAHQRRALGHEGRLARIAIDAAGAKS